MIRICPNCGENTYVEQEQTVDLSKTLKQWEVEIGAKFQPETLSEYEGKHSQLYKCSSCNFGAFIPAHAGTANFYNDITVDSDYYVHEKWEFKKTFKLIKKYNIQNILDYGCGGGSFLKQVLQKFPHIALDGFDQNPQANLAFGNSAIGFVNDLKKHQGKKYDMLTAFQILEHLEDPFATLKELKDSINNDGILIISVPNTTGPIRHYADALTEIPPHHVNRFSYSSLKVFLENENFRIEDVAYEPLSKTLWGFYLPVIVEKSMGNASLKIYKSLKGPKFVSVLTKILNFSSLKTIPIKGHSIYIVARKCAV